MHTHAHMTAHTYTHTHVSTHTLHANAGNTNRIDNTGDPHYTKTHCTNFCLYEIHVSLNKLASSLHIFKVLARHAGTTTDAQRVVQQQCKQTLIPPVTCLQSTSFITFASISYYK